MKILATLFCSICSLVNSQNPQTTKEDRSKHEKINHAAELIENGFLKYADSSMLESLKARLTNSFDIYSDDLFKIVHVDAEELAEFSFDFFLPALNNVLVKRGFKLSALKLNDNDDSFDAVLNSDTIELYTQSDLDFNAFWDKAPRNFFKKVNELLQVEKCSEKFYLLYGGNDLHVLLLTDKEFSIVSDYYKTSDRERPYKP